jgi:thiaminase/transcriptional activator TenA
MKKIIIFIISIIFPFCLIQAQENTSFTQRLREKGNTVWEAAYNHPFVQEIGKGTLEKEKFQYYLLQDYLYLLQYAKVYAFAVIKAQDEATMTYFSNMLHLVLASEMDMHRSYMKEWGITDEQVAKVEMSLGNRSYTSFLLSTATVGDVLSILVATLPCTWTYSDYAIRLKQQYGHLRILNPYQKWIDNYAQEEYAGFCKQYTAMIDKLTAGKTETELKALEDIFMAGMRYELLFWESCYE